MAESNQLTKYERDLLFIIGICPDCEAASISNNLKAGVFVNVECINCGSKFFVYPPTFAERIGGACGTT